MICGRDLLVRHAFDLLQHAGEHALGLPMPLGGSLKRVPARRRARSRCPRSSGCRAARPDSCRPAVLSAALRATASGSPDEKVTAANRRDILHDPANAFLVGAHAIGDRDRVSTRAVAVERAGSAPFSPMYQLTVFAGVPATSAGRGCGRTADALRRSVEEIVRGDDGGGGDQGGVGERLDLTPSARSADWRRSAPRSRRW